MRKPNIWEQRAEAADMHKNEPGTNFIATQSVEAVARLKEKISACEKFQEIMKDGQQDCKKQKAESDLSRSVRTN